MPRYKKIEVIAFINLHSMSVIIIIGLRKVSKKYNSLICCIT